MKKISFLAPASLLVLTACSSGHVTSVALDQQLENPLYAEFYYDTLVDHMVNLVIQNDPAVQNSTTKEVIEENRVEGLRLAREANALQAQGKIGNIVSDDSYAIGEVLLLNNVLYVSPGFETIPGADLHVYLSTVLDLRDGAFPDETAVDLGVIKSAFGAHSYEVPAMEVPEPGLRTMVLFDTKLNKIYGFAQLQARN